MEKIKQKIETTWLCIHFNDLKTKQLYDLMRLRQEVFVVEQDCSYLDADGKDLNGWQIMGYQVDTLVACTRILPKGNSYEDAVSLGRVATVQSVRGQGLGKELMRVSMEWTEQLFPGQRIRIGAQTYLVRFYEGFGFQVVGEGYLEDGIPHVEMMVEGE